MWSALKTTWISIDLGRCLFCLVLDTQPLLPGSHSLPTPGSIGGYLAALFLEGVVFMLILLALETSVIRQFFERQRTSVGLGAHSPLEGALLFLTGWP